MALTVGTDSYFSIAEADDYFTARGVTAWTGAEDAKEAAGRRGTSYLDNQYRDRWKGYRAEQAQKLAWPRVAGYAGSSAMGVYGLVDSDGFEIPANETPQQVKNAAMEAALLALTGVTLEPRLERGGRIKSLSKGVGPLSKSTTWEDGAPTVDRYTVIDGLLRGLVKSSPGSTSGNVSLVRA